VIASFHLLQHGRPVLTPSKRFVHEVPGLRFWRPLNVGGDFAWFRQHPTRRALYQRLRPDLHRWGYYAIWQGEADLEAFLGDSSCGKAWQDSAVERYHVWLRPVDVRGPWQGTRLLQDCPATSAGGGPVAHLVRLDLSLRGTLAMWGSAAPNVFGHLPDSDELLLGVPLVDRPYTQPLSFSLWRTHDAAMSFVHREGGHRAAVERVRRAQSDLLRRFSSASYAPYRCQGTWQGSDPLAAVGAAA
jgi:hypothetical protein